MPEDGGRSGGDSSGEGEGRGGGLGEELFEWAELIGRTETGSQGIHLCD